MVLHPEIAPGLPQLQAGNKTVRLVLSQVQRRKMSVTPVTALVLIFHSFAKFWVFCSSISGSNLSQCNFVSFSHLCRCVRCVHARCRGALMKDTSVYEGQIQIQILYKYKYKYPINGWLSLTKSLPPQSPAITLQSVYNTAACLGFKQARLKFKIHILYNVRVFT